MTTVFSKIFNKTALSLCGLSLLAGTTLLAGCSSTPPPNLYGADLKVDTSTSQLFHESARSVTVSTGPLLTGKSGDAIEQVMDQGDRLNMIDAVVNKPIQQPTLWINRRRGAHYRVKILVAAYSPKGYYCRKYRVTLRQYGDVNVATGVLCRIHEHTWVRMQ